MALKPWIYWLIIRLRIPTHCRARRTRLIDLHSRIRRARFDADTEALDVLTAELYRVLDIYNPQRKAQR